MKFLIQQNLINHKELSEIKEAVSKYPTDFVNIIPFSDSICVDTREDYIPYGSTSLTYIGYSQYNWSGLHFSLDTFNYEAALQNRDDMLNDNVMRLDDAIEFLSTHEPTTDFFVRPSEDLKQFSGIVMGAKECHDWFKDMMECATSGTYKLDASTKVVVSLPKYIDTEIRCFIIGRKVVASSIYRQNGFLSSKQFFNDDLQYLADKWLPDECCVMDIAYTADGYKVIEFNCLNSSGFYTCDKEAIFKSLWEFHKKG